VKRAGILNAELNRHLSMLGHTDTVVVSDCGLPHPPGVPVVDLAVVFGVPSFEEVLRAVVAEIVVEEAQIAVESLDRNPAVRTLVESLCGSASLVTHDEFKRLSSKSRLLIRTGEASPYANVILHCGVPF